MEASAEATVATFDVSKIHDLLNKAEQEFHKLFSGSHAPSTVSHIERVTPHLDTVRMVVDQAADEAGKE